MPSMETSVAFEVCHERDAVSPDWILLGVTDIEAVGAGGGGGGGGGAGATFLWHAPSIIAAVTVIAIANCFIDCCFTIVPPFSYPWMKCFCSELKRDKSPNYRGQNVPRVKEHNRRSDAVLKNLTEEAMGPPKTIPVCRSPLCRTSVLQRSPIRTD
jgi:hypothetical protein